ncbi:hypothetical protein SDC9_180503 [bioreactor metagenome]|uniref:Uncharacterized protein n=1 Tax=bioreactor metagenome TaxID=1076179 RepID=A0A645H2W7_9ZZZZ
MKHRLIAKYAGGSVGIEDVANLDLVEKIVRNKPAGRPCNGDLIISALTRRRTDAVWATRAHTANFNKQIEILPRLKRRQIAFRTGETNDLRILARVRNRADDEA